LGHLAAIGAKLKRLSQGITIEDGQQNMGHARGQGTEPTAMDVDNVDQSDDQQPAGMTEEQETEPQAKDSNAQVSLFFQFVHGRATDEFIDSDV
jgi:hypothetical protein